MSDRAPPPDADGGADPLEHRDQDALIIRAEQALLGAIMSDPARQAALLDLLHPSDMHRPYHGQVLAAMQRLRARSIAPAPARVRAELATDPDLPRRISLDGVLLADLLEAVPLADHAPAYAAMVIDHSIRERVALVGSRMIQAAETGELETAQRVTAAGHRAVQDSQARWNALPEQIRREPPQTVGRRTSHAQEAIWQLQAAGEEVGQARHHVGTGTLGDLAVSLESIAQRIAKAAAESRTEVRGPLPTAGESRPHGRAAEAAGEQLLRDLAADPKQVTNLQSWLHPGHFARASHGQIYRLVRDMHTSGMPVDPVTIAWEAGHRGIAVEALELEGGGCSILRTRPARGRPARGRPLWSGGLDRTPTTEWA
ncbi:MAG: DnaB-like helicase N-terminal domain-containing protein [Streptosporangiaceae bacterium]